MSPDNTNQENQNAEGTATAQTTDRDAQLKEAVTLADSFAATTRDKKNTAITLLTAPADEVAAVKSFMNKVQLQAESSKQIYKLSVEAARARNAGKRVPPSKQKKAAPAAGK